MPRHPVRTFLAAWRVARRIIRVTFRARLEYRAEFLLNIGIGVVWQVSIIVFATVLLGRSPGMGGWSSEAVLLIAAMRMLSHGLFVLFLGRVFMLSQFVQEGLIDGFLLRPMPVYRQVQLAYFPANAIGDLLVGGSMFAGAVWRSDLHWTVARSGYATAALIGGMLMEGAIFTAISSFHLHHPAANAWSSWTEELLATFGNYPLKILPGMISGVLTFGLPLAFVAYFPAAVLTGNTSGLGVPVVLAAASPLVGLAAFAGSRLLWNRRLSRYTGVNG